MTQAEATYAAREPEKPALWAAPEAIGRMEALDGVAGPLATLVGKIGPGKVKDALSGTWLGHALHPLLTDLPIGTWTSAVVLDVAGGEESERAAERLVGVGVLAALPTALTGLTEWADTQRIDGNVRRVGIVHAAANVLALGLFAGSFAARRAGNASAGKRLATGGLAALALGGHLGGHLSYAKGVGVDQTAFEARPGDWRRVLDEGELREGEPAVVDVDGSAVMVVRADGEVRALANRCCHRGGPLAQGEVRDGEVTCPWHGSTFRLDDGSVVRGPAAYPQPVYDVRVRDGGVEVRAHGS